MPELPEVETVRQGLRPAMEGNRIGSVEQRRPDLRFPFPPHFAERLEGRMIADISRRAKYLLFHLDDQSTLLAHLGMSGSFRVESARGKARPGAFHHERGKLAAHDHVVFEMTAPDGAVNRITYNDPRRFGFMDIVEAGGRASNRFLRDLGVEPTGNSLSGQLLSGLFSGRAAPLKSCLLDQRMIAGLGNIYVCEALWRSRLSPERPAGSISEKPEAVVLAASIRQVIADAIKAGGSSLRDYVQTDGSLGYFQHSFSVYGREGEPCTRHGCRGTVSRIIQSGRSTFLCASCQS